MPSALSANSATVRTASQDFHPLLARSRIVHSPVGPVAYDCVDQVWVSGRPPRAGWCA